MREAEWVGRTPDPPSQTLQGVVEAPHSHDDFEFVVNGAGDLLRAICPGCGQAWRCEPL